MLMIITYNNYSLNCQAVWDALGQFINIEVKWASSIHDARVFANCNIQKAFANEKFKTKRKTRKYGIAKNKLQIKIESDDHLFLSSFHFNSLHIKYFGIHVFFNPV